MNVLAFDTCFASVSVAVSRQGTPDDVFVCELSEERASGRAERLMPMIDTAMREAELEFADLDRIAVTVGPGTFTGVRLGVAAARGLALASSKPVVGVTSLRLLASQVSRMQGETRRNPHRLAVCFEAGRGMIYAQLFDAKGAELSEALFLRPEDFASRIGTGPVLVAGSAARPVAEALSAAGISTEGVLPELALSARALAFMVPELTPSNPIKPFYLRPPDAKPQASTPMSRSLP